MNNIISGMIEPKKIHLTCEMNMKTGLSLRQRADENS